MHSSRPRTAARAPATGRSGRPRAAGSRYDTSAAAPLLPRLEQANALRKQADGLKQRQAGCHIQRAVSGVDRPWR